MQRWIILRIDLDKPKIIATYADEKQARRVYETLMRENKERKYALVDGEDVDKRGYLY